MERVNILVEALPYIKQFYNKKVMIKYGGHAMVDEDAMASTARDTVLLKYVGMQPIVVHGGGPETILILFLKSVCMTVSVQDCPVRTTS